MVEHPVQQPIRAICVVPQQPNFQGEEYIVGLGEVTRIEACQKSGLHADLPYVRVWADDTCLAEFCQHNIVGVYFEDPPVEVDPASDTSCTGRADCTCDVCVLF